MIDTFSVTTVALADKGYSLYYGSLDNTIKAWDFRNCDLTHSLFGHCDIITSLRISPNGKFLLSNSMDKTLRTVNYLKYSFAQTF